MRKGLALCLALALLTGWTLAFPGLAEETALARASTPLTGVSDAQRANIALAVQALDGARVGAGATFSFNDAVGPRTKGAGYVSAINGRGGKKLGGGVSQVATTLYLALKQLDEVDYLQKRTYGNEFAGGYVESGYDAIVTDYKNGVDFRFVNGSGFSIHIRTTKDAIECELTSAQADQGGAAEASASETATPAGKDDVDEEINQGGEPTAAPDMAIQGDISGASAALQSVSDDPDVTSSSQIRLDGSEAALHNIKLACSGIYGVVLKRGATFSFNQLVGPGTEAGGYQAAEDGRGEKVAGGGVSVVASALWLAVKDMEDVEVTKKATYGASYHETYVGSADDAILTDYEADQDFRFRYKGKGSITLYTYVSDGVLTCEIRRNNS